MRCQRCKKDVRLDIGGVCICDTCKTLIIQEWAISLGLMPEPKGVVTTPKWADSCVIKELASCG